MMKEEKKNERFKVNYKSCKIKVNNENLGMKKIRQKFVIKGINQTKKKKKERKIISSSHQKVKEGYIKMANQMPM